MRTVIIKESTMKSKTSNFIAVIVMIVGIAHIVDAQEKSDLSSGSAYSTPASTVTLTIEEAIRRAIETNLTTRIAKEASLEAPGRTTQACASSLPRITG